MESFVRHYYETLDEYEAAQRGKKILYPLIRHESDSSNAEYWALTEKLKGRERCIASMFIDAVKEHDRKRIVELANAVEFFKNKRYPKLWGADHDRLRMIWLKTLLEHYGERITIRQLAQFLAQGASATGKKLETPADGFSALRRKCKQLNFPLAESRKTSGK